MIQALALAQHARSRALIGLLMLSTAVVAVVESGPIGQALASLTANAPQIVVKPLPRLAAQTNGVQPFYLTAGSAAEQERAIRCMTDAIYYEAAHEPEQGQRAVAQVVVNRVRDKHFPKSVCGVVYEGWQRTTGCQFSFVCDGSIRRRHADPALWSSLRPLAIQALNGHVEPAVGTSTHYYATYVRPNWVRSVAQVAEIGKHIFCSWKGKAGLPSALDEPYQGGELQIADAALDGVRLTVKHKVEKVVRSLHLARHGRVHGTYYA